MTTRRGPVLAFSIGVVLFALPACSTQEIDPEPVQMLVGGPGWNSGALEIAFAPWESDFAAEQADNSVGDNFHLFVDGAQVAGWSYTGSLEQIVVSEGALNAIGFLPAGAHHFEIRAGFHGPTAFAGDGVLLPGAQTNLYLFGPPGGVEGRFVSLPYAVPAGTAHVSLINLIRTGQSLEVVACADISHCTPVSPPLAIGEAFAADVPLDGRQDWPTGQFAVSNGAAIGYRQVPTPAVPDPPLHPFFGTLDLVGPLDPATLIVSAPLYMSPEGNVQGTF
jgi:hypothetical protein